jgi:hypothetical protein
MKSTISNNSNPNNNDILHYNQKFQTVLLIHEKLENWLIDINTAIANQKKK